MQQERKLRYNMCILFLYYCDKPSADGYRLIVASNRDEYYDRPTARATFWEKNPKIIAGKIVQIAPCKAKWGNPYSGIPGTICSGNLESWVLESVIQLSSTDKGSGIQSKTVRWGEVVTSHCHGSKIFDDSKPKKALKKWICTASNFIDLIQFHLIWQILAKFCRVESKGP